MWKANISLKIKNFIWLVKKNRALTKFNLAKKGWIGSTQCMFCSVEESTYHIFVIYFFIASIWN
jgi:zinc-binding in reverse transcriptase